jgi:hypothetical protein
MITFGWRLFLVLFAFFIIVATQSNVKGDWLIIASWAVLRAFVFLIAAFLVVIAAVGRVPF